MRVLVVNHISLDGVLQGPGRPNEDTRGDFRHGGWAAEGNDPAMQTAIGERMGHHFAWLFGRRSYDGMLTHWNQAGGPFKDGLNRTTKYVASTNADADLPWPNSTLLSGDVPAEVAALREQPGGNLVIMGSGQLIRSLLPYALVDELFLMIHPVLLGSGHQLFGPQHDLQRLRLVEATPTATGVLMATYQPFASPPGGVSGDNASKEGAPGSVPSRCRLGGTPVGGELAPQSSRPRDSATARERHEPGEVIATGSMRVTVPWADPPTGPRGLHLERIPRSPLCNPAGPRP